MKNSILLLIFILSLILSTYSVNAIRMSADELSPKVNFKLGEKYVYQYYMTNNQDRPTGYRLQLVGSDNESRYLIKYVKVVPSEIPLVEPGKIVPFRLEFDFYEPSTVYGTHTIELYVEETSSGQSTGMGAVGALGTPFTIRVLYPGLRINAILKLHDINENEIEKAEVHIENIGDTFIKKAYADIYFYDAKNTLVGKTTTNSESIESFQTKILKSEFNTNGLSAGRYKAIAEVYYDGYKETLEGYFNIGKKYVSIGNHTRQMEQDKINPFEIEITSHWNGNLIGVYGEIVFNKNIIKTPSIDLSPFQTAKLNAYIETNGIEVGEKPIHFTIKYEGLQTDKQSTVEIVKKKVEETPLQIQYFSITNILLMILILILIIFLIIWVKDRRKKNEIDIDKLLKK